MNALPHAEIVARYRAGTLRIIVDRAAAARFVSARAMLPFVLLPVFGLAVGLVLTGRWLLGVALFLAALGLRALVRGAAQGFVLTRILEDPVFYEQSFAAGLIQFDETAAPPTPQDG